MTLTFNPIERALLEAATHRLTRAELVLALSPLAGAETIERAIGHLADRRLLERLELADFAGGQATYVLTDAGERALRRQRIRDRIITGRRLDAV